MTKPNLPGALDSEDDAPADPRTTLSQLWPRGGQGMVRCSILRIYGVHWAEMAHYADPSAREQILYRKRPSFRFDDRSKLCTLLPLRKL